MCELYLNTGSQCARVRAWRFSEQIMTQKATHSMHAVTDMLTA